MGDDYPRLPASSPTVRLDHHSCVSGDPQRRLLYTTSSNRKFSCVATAIASSSSSSSSSCSVLFVLIGTKRDVPAIALAAFFDTLPHRRKERLNLFLFTLPQCLIAFFLSIVCVHLSEQLAFAPACVDFVQTSNPTVCLSLTKHTQTRTDNKN